MTTSNPFIKTLLFLLFLFAIPATALAQVDMAMSASDDPDPVVAGSGASNLVHVLTATNNGPDNATGVFVNVVPLLPAVGVSVESITPSLGSVDPDTLVWTIGDHPAGVSADLTITLTVGPDAAEGTDVISATGTVGADQPDSDESNNTAVDPTSVAIEVDMAMSASDDPDPVVAGSGAGNLVHVLTATNNGPSDATGVFVDVLPVLPAGVGLDSVTADIGTFDANTLVWTIGNHPAGVSANLTITLTVGPDAAEGTDVISATGTVGADQPDSDESNNTAVDPTSVARSADMAMSASDDPDPVLAGSGTGNLVHVLTATNNGPSDATGVFVDVVPVLPAGVGLDSVTADIGTFDANTLVWTIGNHPVDVSANLTITLTVGYDAAEGTDVISATGTVGADQPDPDESNNTAVDPTSIEEAASSASFFATSIDFTDNNLATVTATITCNSGLPLTQSIDISEGADVNFAIEALSFTTPGVTCEIMIAGTDSAYTVMASANGGGAASSCVFVAGTAAAGEALFDNSRNNSCAFIAVADAAIYTVTKDWVVPDAGNEEMDYDVDVTITCATEILTVDGAAHDGSSTVSLVLGDGDSSYVTVDTSAGASQCSANEDISQSGVESEASEDCTNAVLPAGGSASCTFTNTVFFEGIPTLSQYGLVIMALLMLGVGFVGFRRFS